MRTILGFIVAAVGAGAIGARAFAPLPADAATACAELAAVRPAGVAASSAHLVEAGGFTAPGGRGGSAFERLPAFCRVEAVLAPSADSSIRVEVWLPATGWNGRFQGVGNRGWGGAISYAALAQAVSSGYAGASTDTGHTGGGASFAIGHDERVVDAAWRSVHEMTAYAQAVTSTYYGRRAGFSYWNGCSLGGRQGLAEAQRFPADYDGIVVGDPANDVTHLYAARLAWAQAIHRTSTSAIPAGKFPLIHAAALAACDARDGVSDGVIEDPRRCDFDPKVLTCPAGDAPECLTAEQVDSARTLYAPVHHPRTGEVLAPGFERGSELGWGAVAGPQPESNAVDLFRYVVYKDPNWDWHTFDLARDVDRADEVVGRSVNATDPNLAPFFAHGGKLLMYHGWADPQTPPGGSVAYYERIVKASSAGGASVLPVRLFMVPGMGHCEGGDGTDTFDKVAPLADWVERSTAPAQIVAAHLTGGTVDRTRPLCAIGQVARWIGTGFTTDAANFRCAAP